ncbi:hypothetical protein [Streptomyces sp. NPDC059371]|uniref:hypothetical protein n=1 Tax=Streptomyces sp. NPDC059371 TaxID=3346812 RepID=UPI0036A071FC
MDVLMLSIQPVRAKQNKLQRAYPVAQVKVRDKVRLRGAFVDLAAHDPDSRGRIDASCVLAYGLIPEANKSAIVHAPLPTAPHRPAWYRSSAVQQPRTGGASAGKEELMPR